MTPLTHDPLTHDPLTIDPLTHEHRPHLTVPTIRGRMTVGFKIQFLKTTDQRLFIRVVVKSFLGFSFPTHHSRLTTIYFPRCITI